MYRDHEGLAAAQARHLLSRPWDVPLWSRFWLSSYEAYMRALGFVGPFTPMQFWQDVIARAEAAKHAASAPPDGKTKA